jgi:uncharacterized ion transporter superfamily protein YfcC
MLVYGMFTALFSYSYAIETHSVDMPSQNYTTPESASFFTTLENIVNVTFQKELWFIQTILGTIFTFSVVFLFMRYLRGVR